MEKERSIKEIFPNCNEPIEKCIVIDGVQYYHFPNIYSVPVERYDAIMVANDEWEMRCTKEFLKAHTKAVENALNKGKLVDVAHLNKILQERLELGNDFSTIYKLVACIVFDETENPNRIDFKKINDKTKIFREAKLDDFFFQLKILKSIPLEMLSTEELRQYFIVVKQIKEIHLQTIGSNLLETDKMTEWFKSLMSQENVVSL